MPTPSPPIAPSEAIKHIVFFSSGIGSWAAAKRVAEQHGTENLTLLFADTGVEDSDNYRFLHEAAANVGGKLVIVRNKKDADVFANWRSHGAIANNRMPFCSFDLKHKPCREWLKENAGPNDVFYVGIDWSEMHRLKAIEQGWAPNKVVAPMVEPPYLDKHQLLNQATTEGLKPPRLYHYGFSHSNCGGGCVRAGIAHWRHLFKTLPDVYRRWEGEEQAMRVYLNKDVSILTRERDGIKQPLTLTQLREEIEADGQMDLLDWGGCGCFVDEEVAA